MSKVWFIIGAVAFITVVIELGALMGEDLIPNAPERPNSFEDASFWSILTNPLTNILYFIQLVPLSSGYQFLAVILSILGIGVIWSLVELARGV